MSIIGKINGPGQREFSLHVNPKSEAGFAKVKTINRQEWDQLSAGTVRFSPLCLFAKYSLYLQRGNCFCDA